MKTSPPRIFGISSIVCITVILSGLFSAVLPAQVADADQKMGIAKSQHEIILLLIKENRLTEIQPELDKIFNLHLPTQFEERIISSMLIISEAYLQNQRFDLCLRMLERGVVELQLGRSKAKLFQEMGYVYKVQGDDKKAMDCFRKAQQWAETTP